MAAVAMMAAFLFNAPAKLDKKWQADIFPQRILAGTIYAYFLKKPDFSRIFSLKASQPRKIIDFFILAKMTVS